MNSDYELDLDVVRRHLRETQVVGFYFPFLRKTLLLDTRTSDTDGPFLAIVPMVQSMDDRIKSLRRLRPRFPRPESLTLIPWPRSLQAFERLGLWELFEQRVRELDGDILQARASAVLDELRTAEQAQTRFAITGQGYETVWQRTR